MHRVVRPKPLKPIHVRTPHVSRHVASPAHSPWVSRGFCGLKDVVGNLLGCLPGKNKTRHIDDVCFLFGVVVSTQPIQQGKHKHPGKFRPQQTRQEKILERSQSSRYRIPFVDVCWLGRGSIRSLDLINMGSTCKKKRFPKVNMIACLFT